MSVQKPRNVPANLSGLHRILKKIFFSRGPFQLGAGRSAGRRSPDLVMHFIYIDDSGEQGTYIFSCLAVPAENWNKTFEVLKEWRLHLKQIHGISTKCELHAHQFLSGRGTLGALNSISRHRRSQIFHKTFDIIEWLGGECGVRCFNVCKSEQDQAFEWLLNRIQRTMVAWNSHAFLICDEGKEAHYTKMVRRMKVFNHIPSKLGTWAETGASTKNIPLDRIIEDPHFKKSHQSLFIQKCDFLAYGLLRRELPTPKARRYGIHKSFEQLDEVLVKECNRKDKFGIIR